MKKEARVNKSLTHLEGRRKLRDERYDTDVPRSFVIKRKCSKIIELKKGSSQKHCSQWRQGVELIPLWYLWSLLLLSD